MAADDSAKRRSDSFVPAVDRWYYTAIIPSKQANSFSFLHFYDECFSLYDFYFAVSCNSLPNFTKKPFFLMALANFDLSVLLRAF